MGDVKKFIAPLRQWEESLPFMRGLGLVIAHDAGTKGQRHIGTKPQRKRQRDNDAKAQSRSAFAPQAVSFSRQKLEAFSSDAGQER
jgi:hypothetical protein